MKPLSSSASVCRRCQAYTPEGRRGGHCQQLNVAVQGAWAACALAIPPFSPAWENFEDIMVWQQKTLAAIQTSAVPTMTDTLPDSPSTVLPLEISPSEVLSAHVLSAHDGASPIGAGEPTESSSMVATCSYTALSLPTASIPMGLKALWL